VASIVVVVARDSHGQPVVVAHVAPGYGVTLVSRFGSLQLSFAEWDELASAVEAWRVAVP
jgi:hypothetical protein